MPLFLLLILSALALILATLVYSWRHTPQGRLDLMPAIVLQLNSWITPAGNVPVEKEREGMRRRARLAGGRLRRVAWVEDRSVPGPGGRIPVRLYHPRPGNKLPLIIYFHGGGWRLGDLDTHDKICRRLALETSWPVLAVDYRRAPENPFPAAPEDAYAAVCWAAENAAELDADPRQLIVAGDSAGGNLAAAVCLRARDERGPAIRFQALIYPVVDLVHLDRPSYRDFGAGFFLTADRMRSFIENYTPEKNKRTDPYASPLLAGSHGDLPPACIITARFDPLCDEGKAYAEALQNAGVPATCHCYEGIFHGFFGLPLFGPKALKALRKVAEEITAYKVQGTTFLKDPL